MPNDDAEPLNGEQERQSIPICLQVFLCLLGILLVLGTVAICILHVSNREAFPEPESLDAGFLLALGVGLLLVLFVPWQRIRIAGLEMERAVQEQAEDFSREIVRLRNENSKLARAAPELSMQEKLILKFLTSWSSWGFTPLRIKNWGGSKSGYEDLRKLRTGEIREFLTNLVADGKVRVRVSRNGNTLYQAR